MTNFDLEATWAYHNRTKHSPQSVRSNPHFLDWANQPLPFKIYPGLDPISLPREVTPTGIAALSAIGAFGPPAESPSQIGRKELGLLMYFTAGITRTRAYPGGKIYFRAAACTGALYEVELYLVCADLQDLAAGVYHFNPADFALRRLREGDWRDVLVQATGGEPAVAQAPLIVVCTGNYWRNAWKYQERTYRHFGWDNGTLLANLLSLCAALGLPARILAGFVDETVTSLLDLDGEREVPFSLVAVGSMETPPPPAPGQPERRGYETVRLSQREVDHPAMRAMHSASSLHSAEEVREWRGSMPESPPHEPSTAMVPLAPLAAEEWLRDPIEQVILRRGSTRRFARQPITMAELSTLLERATRGIPADFLAREGKLLNDLYLIVHAVEGLASGAYFFSREACALEPLRLGEFRKEAAYLGLEQELPGDASVAVFFLSDLQRVLDRFGNRGYRAAHLEAGILGGRLYLAAYALGLGASGLTFYDDDVVNFFSPHANGKSAIFLTALGQRARHKKS